MKRLKKASLLLVGLCALFACEMSSMDEELTPSKNQMATEQVSETNHPTNYDYSPVYRYNFATGKCTSCNGQEGYNALDIEAIKVTKNAECVDLKNQDLIYLWEGVTEDNKYSYNILDGYNFRGANFQKAYLFFNDIKDADLRGAKMGSFSYGYSRITGITDAYTELPTDGCDPKSPDASCRR